MKNTGLCINKFVLIYGCPGRGRGEPDIFFTFVHILSNCSALDHSATARPTINLYLKNCLRSPAVTVTNVVKHVSSGFIFAFLVGSKWQSIMFFLKGTQVGGANLGSFWFSFIFSHKQRLRPLGYCTPNSKFVLKQLFRESCSYSYMFLLDSYLHFCGIKMAIYHVYYLVKNAAAL